MGIGKRIKQAREHLNLTQKELGALIGVTGSAITNYENEVSHPKEPVMYKLLDALQVDANFLFQDEMQQKQPLTHIITDKRLEEINECFNTMNEDGKERLHEQAVMYANNQKYIKSKEPLREKLPLAARNGDNSPSFVTEQQKEAALKIFNAAEETTDL